MPRRASLSILFLAFAAACGPADNDPGPGGVTVGEAKELDEAAAIVEARRQQGASPSLADDEDQEP